jgi:hypothetical protein
MVLRMPLPRWYAKNVWGHCWVAGSPHTWSLTRRDTRGGLVRLRHCNCQVWFQGAKHVPSWQTLSDLISSSCSEPPWFLKKQISIFIPVTCTEKNETDRITVGNSHCKVYKPRNAQAYGGIDGRILWESRTLWGLISPDHKRGNSAFMNTSFWDLRSNSRDTVCLLWWFYLTPLTRKSERVIFHICLYRQEAIWAGKFACVSILPPSMRNYLPETSTEPRYGWLEVDVIVRLRANRRI